MQNPEENFQERMATTNNKTQHSTTKVGLGVRPAMLFALKTITPAISGQGLGSATCFDFVVARPCALRGVTQK